MSQKNAELVKTAYELDPFTASADEIDRVSREIADEDFEFHLPSDYPEGEQVFRGREGMSQLVTAMRDAWGEWRFEVEDLRDADDRVVVFARIVAKGGASGVPIELRTAHLWTIRAGRLRSVHMYRDRSQALEAAGLSE